MVIFLILVHLDAQDKKEFKAQFLEAEYFFLTGEFKEARYIYSELLKQDPANANLEFLIGACYLSNTEEKTKAIPYLEKAVESISPGYREGSYKEKNAPSESLFALARAYHIQNQLAKAITYYQKYHEVMNMQDPSQIDFVLKQIESCKLAEKMLKNPIPCTRTEFSSDFNVYASNNDAVLAHKDSMMIYMRKKPFYSAIMMTRLVKGSWTVPTLINDQLGVDDHLNICSVSSDGKELYLSLEEDQVNDIYVSTLKKGKWSKIEKLNKNINTSYSETHASISSDGKKLYFTSDRPEGEGAMDIYVSTRDDKGEWGPAVNLGKPVNTMYSEETPFISENGEILFFSSMGHSGMGGFDVFYTSRLPDGNWSIPINIGYPISTCDDDLFYYPLGKGRQSLFSGYMDKGEGKQKVYLVNLDTAYHFENIALRGIIRLEDNVRELDSTFSVQIINSKNQDTIIRIKPNQKTGEYSVDLKPGNYEVKTEGKGYTEKKENLTVVDGISKNEIRVETSMKPSTVSSGEYLVIRNLLFGYDDFSLNQEAKTELEKLCRVMQSHPQIYVQVTGHADARGNEDYNLKLSAKRARSVVDYMVSKGISNERFVSLGIGEQENIAMNQNPDGSDNPEGRRLNRYVEIKLINNSDEKIEIANIEVPEYLRPRTDMSYSVLLVKSNDPAYVPKPLQGIKINLIETDHARLFLTDDFHEKAKAIEVLNSSIDNGFPDAKILSRTEKDDLILSLSDRKDANQAPFTIQILALKKPVELRQFEKSWNIKQFNGKDGLFRYYSESYGTKEEALKDLRDKYLKKFPDAFIIPLSRYKVSLSGITETTAGQEYYTIQFSATRKPADKNKYKNLGKVQVVSGEDGYYRYSIGMFTNLREAEIELKRIKRLGFRDAFLRRVLNK
jgi:outer membrane protein OmpA-like peptidoglycan-associated protein/tetratricopeptide (TPR) repeat protein